MFLALIISLILQIPQYHQNEEYLIRNFTVEDGLPVNAVNRILQDDDGYLWFSTLDGLVRYDGYNFRVYNSGNTEGMVSNRIAGMLKSKSNEIWMIHAEGMIMRKAGPEFTTYSSSSGDFKGNAIRIIEGKNGEIWISTSRGIASFNPETKSFDWQEEPLLQHETWAIESIFAGGILAVNEHGLLLWKNGTATVLIQADDFPIPLREVIQIKEFEPGEFWIMGGVGLFRYSLSDRSIDFNYHSREESFGIGNLHPEPDGTFIINSSSGFYSLHPESGRVVKLEPGFSAPWERINLVFRGADDEEIRLTGHEVFMNGRKILEADNIQSGLVDSEGSLWITTQRNGVYQIRRSEFTNITADEIPGFENIYPVVQASDGAIWAGSFVNGIYRISDENRSNWNASNSNLSSNFIRFLHEDADGAMYAGVWAAGLWEQRDNDWQPVHEFNDLFEGEVTVEAMHRDRQAHLLIGSSGRLVIRQNGLYGFFGESAKPGLRSVRVIRESEGGTLFLGTNGNGLAVVKSGSVHHYTRENSELNSNFIRDIFVQSPDTLWLATENLGLNRVVLDEGNMIDVKHVTERDGLIKNSLHRIIETPARHLWISSNGGIMRISLDELNRYADGGLSDLSVLGFNESDGMVNREANGGVQTSGILAADAKLWFPNQKGVTIINPLNISGGNTLLNPRPIIEEVLITGATLPVYHQPFLQIPQGERNLRINFTAPNFSSSDRIQFRYKLDGVNPGWVTGSREAVFTNIPPGDHEFKVQIYRTGNPEVTEASLLISIPHYFYETPWFYGLMGLAGLFLIFGGIKYRTRMLEQRERKLQERVDEQTIALKEADEQKSRFFSGITHELKTPLSLILSPLEDILDKPDHIPDETTRNRLQMMHRNGRQLTNLVDQILDVTKLNSDAIKLTLMPVDITMLTKQIIGQFQSNLEQEEIQLIFDADPVDGRTYIDTGAWERIVMNLMSNAVRFSPRNSTIRIQISNHPDTVSFSITDEGIGIDEKDAANVFEYLYQTEGAEAAEGTGIGLYLVHGLVEQLGGNIGLYSKKGEGARFTVTLRKGADHFRDRDTVVHEPTAVVTSGAGEPVIQAPRTVKNNRTIDTEQILVVEDNHDFREYLASVLSEQYDVRTASEGSEALEALQQSDVSLVISDIMMPGMNGIEFVTKLRQQKHYKYLPVIFLSAKNHILDVEAGLSTGADIYLSKPIQSKLLLSQIAAVLRREKVLKNSTISNQNSEIKSLEEEIKEIVYRQMANPALNVSLLAETLFMSRTKLYKEWKKCSEISVNDFIKKTRMEEARVLLQEKGFSVQAAAAAVGYSDANYFSTSFKKQFGVSP
ncbi:MAG: hybrid sensor histidine kinase/response regulator, partial [Balneolaceae bacterium]